MVNSPIYELIKVDVQRAGDDFIKRKVSPWEFFNVKGVDIEKCNGERITIAGMEFSGTVRLVFWDGYIDDELIAFALTLIESARKKAIDMDASVSDTVKDCRDCIADVVIKVFGRMSAIDQKLRGKGFPQSVNRVNVEERIKHIDQKIQNIVDAYANQATLSSGKTTPTPALSDALELKPSISGISLDLKKLWQWIRAKLMSNKAD